MRFKLFLIASMVFTLSTSAPAQGQKYWETKPYQQWTLREVTQFLEESPWAQTQLTIVPGAPGSSFIATMRLRSALIVRQALLREKQLQMNYDKFTVADKTRFDNETKTFLECSDCEQYYLVTIKSPLMPVSTTPNEQPVMAFDIVSVLKKLSVQDLKPYITLRSDKGEVRELVGFVPPKEEGADAMFVFPRFDNQQRPLLTTSNRQLSFKIDEKLFDGRAVPLKSFTFDVRRLTVNGRVVF